MAEESVTHKTVRASFWGAIIKFSTMGIRFVVTMLLARLLMPSDFGTIALLSIFLALASSVSECGFGNALVRKKECTQQDFNTALLYNVAVGLFLYAILFICAPLIARFYETPILVPVLRVCGLTLLISSVTITQSVQLTRALRFKCNAIVSTTSSLTSGIIGVTAAFCGLGVWALVLQTLSQTFMQMVLIMYFVKWKPTFEFSRKSFKYLWGFGSKMLLTGIISTIYSNIYSLIVGKIYHPRALGLFNRGQTTANIFPSISTSIFLAGSFPILSQLRENRDKMLSVYRKYTILVSFVNVPVCILLAVLAKPFVLFFLTDKWIDAVIYIQVFCIAMTLEPVGQLNLTIFQIEGRTDITLKLEVIKKIIGFTIVCVLCMFSPLALAIGSCSYMIFAYLFNLYFVNKLENISYFQQIKDLAPSFISGIISGAVIYPINHLDVAPLFMLIIGTSIGGILYLILTRYVFKMELHGRIYDMIKNLILKRSLNV